MAGEQTDAWGTPTGAGKMRAPRNKVKPWRVVLGLVLGLAIGAGGWYGFQLINSGTPDVDEVPVVQDPANGTKVAGFGDKVWWRATVTIAEGTALHASQSHNSDGGSSCSHTRTGPFTVETSAAAWTVDWGSGTTLASMPCRDMGPGERVHILGYSQDGSHTVKMMAKSAGSLSSTETWVPILVPAFIGLITFLIVAFGRSSQRRNRW